MREVPIHVVVFLLSYFCMFIIFFDYLGTYKETSVVSPTVVLSSPGFSRTVSPTGP